MRHRHELVRASPKRQRRPSRHLCGRRTRFEVLTFRAVVPQLVDAYRDIVLTGIGRANRAPVDFREARLLFANVAALHSAIMEKEPKDFVSHYIFEPVPFAFSSDLSSWIGWKTTLARLLEVDPQDIVLIGTAAIGYSLNPHKHYKAFDDTSDIDCSVISPYHFEWLGDTCGSLDLLGCLCRVLVGVQLKYIIKTTCFQER